MTMIYGKQKPAKSGHNFIFSRIESSQDTTPHGNLSVAEYSLQVKYQFANFRVFRCILVAMSNRFISFAKVFAW